MFAERAAAPPMGRELVEWKKSEIMKA